MYVWAGIGFALFLMTFFFRLIARARLLECESELEIHIDDYGVYQDFRPE
jgi:hypothetical protein